MRILGIDPGSAVTGFGVVERRDGDLVHVAHGTVRPPRGAPLAIRLSHLHRALREVVSEHRPDVVAVEQVFVAANARAALVLGQARGAVLSAVAEAGLPVSEYSASQIKLAVTGDGRAAKRQVQRMVRRTLSLDCTPQIDAADALAAAIRHAQATRLEGLGVVSRGARRGRGRRRTVAFRAGRAR